MNNHTTKAILRIVLPYTVCAGVWIFCSDRLLVILQLDTETYAQWSMYKGWAFVFVTALLLSILLHIELTARAKDQSKLRQSEERLRLLGDNLPESYVYQYTWTPDGNPQFLYLSAGVERVYGIKVEDALRDAGLLRNQVDPEMLPMLQSAEAGSIQNLTDYTVELRICSVGGQWRWLRLRSHPRRISGGQVVWDGVAEDITDRKRIETALQESENRRRFALESAKMGTWEWDIFNKRIVWDDGTYPIFGRTKADFDGKYESLLRMIHPEDRPMIERNIQRTLSSEIDIDHEFRVIWPDNSVHYVAGKGHIISNAEGEPVRLAGVCWDITNEKLLEEQLRQAQKMEAIGQLAGGIAHDFNNLLMVINGYGECLLQELSDSDRRREDIEEIVNAGNRAASLTRQLLAFSRKQIVQQEILNINTVVSNLEKMLKRLLGEHIELMLHPGVDLKSVRIDPGQVEQIIMNLCVNARDAMPAGGKITIETQNIELQDEYTLSHFEVTPGQYVLLAVSDTGVGMTKEVMERIFEPFYTTKEIGKGTGLGLSTVYGIVKQNAGHVWVYSEPGRGTTFKIYLPTCEPEPPEDETPLMNETIQSTESILIVEDDNSVRKLVERLLVHAGYTVLSASDGEDAIELYKKSGSSIHLLIADMVMPKMGGAELAQKMMEFNPAMKVLYISGYTEAALIRNREFEAGVNLLQKPIDANALLKKVREILRPKIKT